MKSANPCVSSTTTSSTEMFDVAPAAASFSQMTAVPVPSNVVAFTRPDSTRLKASESSNTASFNTVTFTVFAVSPAAKFNVPLTAV